MKKIVIMGASSGIGLELATILAGRGVKIGVAARHTRQLAALHQMYPDNVVYMAIDITKSTAPTHLLKLIEQLGGMDIYIHTAGIGSDNPSLDPAKETSIIETNTVGFARMIDTAYLYFLKNGIRGQIGAITSVAGTKGIGRLSAYSASKAFGQSYLVALQQLSNMEKAGITFTDIRPGWTRTPLLCDDAEYPMTMDVHSVAVEIIRALVLKKRVATIDWRWGLVCGIWQLLPTSMWVKIPVEISMPDPKSLQKN